MANQSSLRRYATSNGRRVRFMLKAHLPAPRHITPPCPIWPQRQKRTLRGRSICPYEAPCTCWRSRRWPSCRTMFLPLIIHRRSKATGWRTTSAPQWRSAAALQDRWHPQRPAGADHPWDRRFRHRYAHSRLRGRIVRAGAAARCAQVFCRPTGHARRREIRQAVRRVAREVPALRLRRHGAGGISAGDRGIGNPPSAAGAS